MNTADNNGRTALIYAVMLIDTATISYAGHLAVVEVLLLVEVLLRAGADANAADRDGRTALTYSNQAPQDRHRAMKEVMRRHVRRVERSRGAVTAGRRR